MFKIKRILRYTYAALLTLLTVFVPMSAMADVWNDQINDPSRFVVLASYGGAAVLDRETGLVWERSPDAISDTWFGDQIHCNQKTLGNRKGWRLPTVQELASLLDPSVPPPGPMLPAGHPFGDLPPAPGFWSATTFALDTGLAWAVSFADGGVSTAGKTATTWAWCVRGGQGVNPQ